MSIIFHHIYNNVRFRKKIIKNIRATRKCRREHKTKTSVRLARVCFFIFFRPCARSRFFLIDRFLASVSSTHVSSRLRQKTNSIFTFHSLLMCNANWRKIRYKTKIHRILLSCKRRRTKLINFISLYYACLNKLFIYHKCRVI